MATFASRIKELRKREGLSQPQLAEKIGLTKGTVSLWERGPRRPDFPTMEKVADFINVSVSYLIGDTDDEGISEETDTNPGGLTDKEAARQSLEEDDESLTSLARMLSQLSMESRSIVSGAILAAYRLDRENGRLESAAAHKVLVRSVALMDGSLDSKSEALNDDS